MNGRTHGSRTIYGIWPVVALVLLIFAVMPIHASAATDPRLHGHLYGVSAVSATDAWAVGESLGHTLIEHWDGNAWRVVASPNVGSSNSLSGVSALSATQAWAVGTHYDTTAGHYHTLIEHWNGTAWSVVASPNVGSGDSSLASVSAVSPSNVWAVGSSYDTSHHTLIEHWNGTAWSVVTSPDVGSTDSLNSVSALSGSNVWAVGSYGDTNTDTYRTLVEHWNGTAWRVVASANATDPNDFNYLEGVSAASASDVWAVGYYQEPSTDRHALIEHWNGTAWSVEPSPSGLGALFGVSAVSATDAWAVGVSDPSSTLIEHWNGTAWSVVTSPNVDRDSLAGVSAVSGTAAWAVGSDLFGTLIERWNGSAWRIDDDVTPPTVSMPLYKLVQPSRLLGSSPPTIAATIVWSGTDPDDAIASYHVQEQVNGGAWKRLALSSSTATSVDVRLAIGSTYSFRVRATDSNGNTGRWSRGPTDTVFGQQETAATYAGTWQTDGLSGAWGGSVEHTSAAGAAASYTFAGDHVAWIGTMGPSYGSADVYIDGTLWKTVDCHASTATTREVLLRFGWDSLGTHTIKIVNLATAGHPRIDVDGFVYLG